MEGLLVIVPQRAGYLEELLAIAPQRAGNLEESLVIVPQRAGNLEELLVIVPQRAFRTGRTGEQNPRIPDFFLLGGPRAPRGLRPN